MLVYYSPAFLRRQQPALICDALCMLAEIYRRSREMWPLQQVPVERVDGLSVTVRIDQIRERSVDEIRHVCATGPYAWFLCPRNRREAVVECHPLHAHAELRQRGGIMLDFRAEADKAAERTAERTAERRPSGGGRKATPPPRSKSRKGANGSGAPSASALFGAWGSSTDSLIACSPRSAAFEGARGDALTSADALRRQQLLIDQRRKQRAVMSPDATMDAQSSAASRSTGWRWPWTGGKCAADVSEADVEA